MAEKLQLRTIGSTGLPVYGGVIYDEKLNVLQGERGRLILREMSEQDPTIGGVLLAIEMLVRQVQWTTLPADDSAKAQEVANFIDECFTDMEPSWEDTLSEILSMLVYGWSWFEILYKRRAGLSTDPTKSSMFEDGKIGWRGWSIRSQETLSEWVFDSTLSDVTAMKQLAPPKFELVEIPRSKSLHFRTSSRRQNPEGRPILRNAYRPWYLKKNIEIIEGIGIERDLAGLPVIYAPARLFSDDASADDKQLFEALKKVVTNVRRDEQEGLLMPMDYDEAGNKMYDLQLLSTAGSRQFDTDKIVNRYDVRIAMSMLADFMMLGQEAVGSYALSSDKTELFSVALGTILDAIAAEVNRNGIPKLVLLNGWPLELAPKRDHGDIESADLGKLGTYLQALSNAGMTIFPNTPLEKFLLEQGGMPAEEVELEDTGLHEEPEVPMMPVPMQPVPQPPGTVAPGQKPSTGQAPPEVAKQLPKSTPKEQKVAASEWAVLTSEAFAEHSGAMVAFMLPEAVASRLALPGGEPSGDLHLTLAFLTNDAAAADDDTKANWREAVMAAAATPKIRGRISGVGRFNPMDSSDGDAVIYASVDAPGLSALRVALVEALARNGVDVPSDHDFTPHVTLAYGDRLVPDVPTLDVAFDRITLVIGDERTEFEMPDVALSASELQAFWANNAVEGKKGFQSTSGGGSGGGSFEDQIGETVQLGGLTVVKKAVHSGGQIDPVPVNTRHGNFTLHFCAKDGQDLEVTTGAAGFRHTKSFNVLNMAAKQASEPMADG